jgi:nucleoside-diphosphate-sugar epimerase
MLYVDDLIDLLLKVVSGSEHLPAEGGDAGQAGAGIYFAAHESTPSYSELGTLIARAMDRRVMPLPILPPVAWTAAAVNQFVSKIRRRPDAFCIDKIREARVPSWAISSEKARTQLGWQASGSLEDQLRAAVEWYEDNGWIKVRRLFGKRKQ